MISFISIFGRHPKMIYYHHYSQIFLFSWSILENFIPTSTITVLYNTIEHENYRDHNLYTWLSLTNSLYERSKFLSRILCHHEKSDENKEILLIQSQQIKSRFWLQNSINELEINLSGVCLKCTYILWDWRNEIAPETNKTS